jgi:aldose 1-epimerase
MNVSQSVVKRTNASDVNIISVTVATGHTKCPRICFEFTSFGAGIRKISLFDEAGDEHLLSLCYPDVLESCSNTSLAGLTVGPNAGRLPGKRLLAMADETDLLEVSLPANEEDKQLHGGAHHLATVNWALEELRYSECCCSISFVTSQPDGLDGWPGNRTYRVRYHVDGRGLSVSYDAASDDLTYLNLTNHTYWVREGLELSIASHRMVANEENFLPKEIVTLWDDTSDFYTIKEDAVYNNAFLLDSMDCAAKLSWPDYEFAMDLITDAPALVVYTGDYLDDAILADGTSCTPGCAVALEAQELWPMTKIRLSSPAHPFSRRIVFRFA